MVIKQYTLQCVCANIYHDINGFKIISQERKKKKTFPWNKKNLMGIV